MDLITGLKDKDMTSNSIYNDEQGNHVCTFQMYDGCPYFVDKMICVNHCANCLIKDKCAVRFEVIGQNFFVNY